MSDNTIEQPPEEPIDEGEPAPDQQGRPANAELAKWRHRTKAAEDRAGAAELALEAMSAKVSAAQRQIVEQRVAGRVAPTALRDFLDRTDLSELVGAETGDLDGTLIDAHTAAVLQENPHMAGPRPGTPLIAPASNVVGGVGIGGPPSSILDPRVASTPEPTWAQIMQDGAKGQ